MRYFLSAVLLLMAQAAAAQEMDRVAFLLGTWTATGSGQPGTGTGAATFSSDVQGHVIIRRSFAEYPAADGRPASRHDDVMVIYAQDGALRADFYDSEGHVIRYAVTTPANGQAIFVSDPVHGQSRYRLTYRLEGSILKGQFEIAPAEMPDAFRTYLSWDSKKHP
jgi:hypothetical protein